MSREYISAGRAVDAVLKGTNFKAFCSANVIGKLDYALASETLKYKDVLTIILEGAAVTAKSLDIASKGMLYVMCYEILIGAGKIRGGGAVKRALDEVIPILKLVLQNLMTEKNAANLSDLLPESVKHAAENQRQYLRINTLKVSATTTEVLESVRLVCPEASLDGDVPNLIVLPPTFKASFGEDDRVKRGELIIQDKGSCLPSQVLMDEWEGGDVIDACAAPGNKTSHMAALLSAAISPKASLSDTRIWAFDKDRRRASLLQERMVQAGADASVVATNADFLSLDVAQYATVHSILLDPSCSGSGMTKSLDKASTISSTKRIAQIVDLQLSVLRKAMSFPNCTTIVYSTCSIHIEENENVVATILSDEQANSAKWRLKAPPRFNGWTRRGKPCPGLNEEQSACLLRSTCEDGTNGMFVCLLVKEGGSKGKSEEGNKKRQKLH